MNFRRPGNSAGITPQKDHPTPEYQATFESAVRRLKTHISNGRIVGSDMSQFVVADRGNRGVEVYGDEESGVILDPAIGEDLQGEIRYQTFDLALDAAVRWLDGCDLQDLQPAV